MQRTRQLPVCRFSKTQFIRQFWFRAAFVAQAGVVQSGKRIWRIRNIPKGKGNDFAAYCKKDAFLVN